MKILCEIKPLPTENYYELAYLVDVSYQLQQGMIVDQKGDIRPIALKRLKAVKLGTRLYEMHNKSIL